MIFFGVLLGFLAVSSAVEQELFEIPQKNVLRLKELATPCALEYNVDPELFRKIADGTLPRDDATNKYLYCAALKGGFVEEDGHMVVDKIAGYIRDHPKVKEFKEALTKCNEVTKENPVATIVEMNRCLTGTAPIRFVL